MFKFKLFYLYMLPEEPPVSSSMLVMVSPTPSLSSKDMLCLMLLKEWT